MATLPGQEGALARVPAPGLAASVRLLLLRVAPFVLATAIEPWMAAATAVGLLGRKLKRRAAEYTPDPAFADAAESRRQVWMAATWLLGICVLIIVTLKVTDQNARTWADEIAWIAGGFMALSIVLSRTGRSAAKERVWQSGIADWSFLIGSAALLVSVIFSLLLL